MTMIMMMTFIMVMMMIMMLMIMFIMKIMNMIIIKILQLHFKYMKLTINKLFKKLKQILEIN